MTHQASRPVRRRGGPVAVLAMLLLAGLPPAAALAADPEPVPATTAVPSRGPASEATPEALVNPPVEPNADPAIDPPVATSVHHVEALAHARDRLSFTPGRRVEVPFRPRAGDRWTVGGVRPRPLPAGRAAGTDMARSPQGSQWTGTASEPIPAETDVLSTADAAGDLTADTAGGGPFREVFGFLPYWELADSGLDLDFSVLSTIAYFSVGVDRAGNLLKQTGTGAPTSGWGGWTSSRMTGVIEDAHRSGTRVVLTITSFAWGTGEAAVQAALLGSPTARANLARQAAAAVRDRGADGINLDFEPIVAGYADEFTALVRSVRSELDAIAPGYQLTFDTTGFIGNYPLEAATAPGGADAIFVMGYDFRTAGSSPVGSIAPLQGAAYDISDAVAQYTARVPASKLILGVPYYGRVWSTETDKAGSVNISGTKYGASTTSIYSSAVATASQHGRRWDTREASPWVAYRREHCTTTYGCVTAWRQLWYDDAQSLRLKYDLVNDRGLRGAGIWALGYDNGHVALDQALAEKFVHDVTGPVAGINFVPWRQRDAGFLVGWSGRDVSGIAAWDVQVSTAGGPWAAWLTRTTATSGVFLGQSGTGYAFRVRATDRKGNVGAWNVTDVWRAAPKIAVGGFAGVRTDGLVMRAGPGTGTAELGRLRKGQIISIVGGPVGAGGYTWWEAVGPLREWQPVGPVTRFWVAQGTSSTPWLVGSRAPNTTIVDAVLRDLSVGANTPSDAGEPAARAFSPNGDGRRDTIAIGWTNATALERLEVRVLRPDGSLAGTIPLNRLGAGAQRFEWDGRVGGSTLPDGTYLLALAGTAGGVSVAAPSSQPATAEQLARFGILLDTTPPALGASGSTSAVISPNNDGRHDTLRVSIGSADAVAWHGTITGIAGPATGTVVRSGALSSGAWTWDGLDNTGAVPPDGRYRIVIWSYDAAGNGAPRSWSVTLDTTPPAVSGSLALRSISPNGDGVADSTTLSWTGDDAVAAHAEVVNGSGIVAAWTVAPNGTLAWDGRSPDGTAIPDGAYVLRLVFSDAAGNPAISDHPVTLDRTLAAVAWTPALFFPHDRDALAPTATASYRLLAGARTSVRILRQDGRYVRTAWSGVDQPAGTHRWTWDGRAGTGYLVPRGWYRVVVTATSGVSTTTLSRLVLVDAFTLTPSSTTPRGGEVLTLDIRSAEPLVAAPTVTLRQAGIAPVTKTALGVGSRRFRVAFDVAASAGPATLTVAARDGGGATNSQVLGLTVR